jgi:hypothetical protein
MRYVRPLATLSPIWLACGTTSSGQKATRLGVERWRAVATTSSSIGCVVLVGVGRRPTPILCLLASANSTEDVSLAAGNKSTTHSVKVARTFERYSMLPEVLTSYCRSGIIGERSGVQRFRGLIVLTPHPKIGLYGIYHRDCHSCYRRFVLALNATQPESGPTSSSARRSAGSESLG